MSRLIRLAGLNLTFSSSWLVIRVNHDLFSLITTVVPFWFGFLPQGETVISWFPSIWRLSWMSENVTNIYVTKLSRNSVLSRLYSNAQLVAFVCHARFILFFTDVTLSSDCTVSSHEARLWVVSFSWYRGLSRPVLWTRISTLVFNWVNNNISAYWFLWFICVVWLPLRFPLPIYPLTILSFQLSVSILATTQSSYPLEIWRLIQLFGYP